MPDHAVRLRSRSARSTLRNRIALSPMCQYSAVDGYPGRLARPPLRRARDRRGGPRRRRGDGRPPRRAASRPATWASGTTSDAEALGEIARAIKAGGAAAGIQIAHAGRKASTARPWEGGAWLPPEKGGWATAAPSALAFGPGYAAPRAPWTRAGMPRGSSRPSPPRPAGRFYPACQS